jgi:protein-tyrosine phosphatase
MWEKEGIQFTQIPVVNRETMSLDQLDKAVDIIAQTVQRKGKVYVHCNTGLERSAMVVIAYLIKYQKLSVEQAVKFVKRQRPSIDFDKPTQLTKLYEYRGYLTRPSYVESPKKSTTTSEAGTQF